ncbi:TcmI family type II polyketide cyclase [Actinomadura algeriensis]|uniref:Deacylase n=1 Tax=Actinomadura algeriensis TaxID=1679523 RepID=A0ABR9JIZ1_9ACTN|nr:TcmI family type II polyketide cyclase [Actinomadura algeriensis]MBE1530525.1 putative deacylase [Actinomadura algeriensis]
MDRVLIVARMRPSSEREVARLFAESDEGTELPAIAGTVSRSLFAYQDLYFHLSEVEESADRTLTAIHRHPDFVGLSKALSEHVQAYDPRTWRSPADAVAREFYRWEAGAGIVHR